jgi:hypothetical protein
MLNPRESHTPVDVDIWALSSLNTSPRGRSHPASFRDLADKRHQQGDSRKDTLRVLKRYIARETFSIIRAALTTEHAFAKAA